MKNILLGIVLTFNLSAYATKVVPVEKMSWNGVDVIWLKDNKFPTYTIQVYFGDGALSDNKKRLGETEMMFSNIGAGTDRYSQKQISDNLDFFGIKYGSKVYHEYSTFSYSGLIKDLIPTSK